MAGEVSPEPAASQPADDRQAFRSARGKFLAMAGAYAMGTFNDNFFKQAASLLAIASLRPELQGWAAALFTLPYVVLAAPAGWLADRFPKRRIVIGSKAVELAAMALGAAGVCLLSWPLVLGMVFLMGVQAAVFSPALNGSVPELYPAHYILKANSVLKMAVTTSILAGIICAGLALSAGTGSELSSGRGWSAIPPGRLAVAIIVLAVAAMGLLSSLFVPRRPAARPDAPFPWAGPVDTARVLWGLRKDRLLSIVIWVDAFVWFIAVLQVLLVNQIGMMQLGLGERDTSYLVVAELAGVAVGGLACGKLVRGDRWFRVLAPAALALAASLGLMALTPLVGSAAVSGAVSGAGSAGGGATLRTVFVAASLVLAGLAGGVLLVPLEAFIQARPDAGNKGRIIAAANCAAFLAMLVAGGVQVGVSRMQMPTTAYAMLGLPTAAVGLWLWRVLPSRERAT